MFDTIKLLLRTTAPIEIYYYFAFHYYFLPNQLKNYQTHKNEFASKIKKKSFTYDWFTCNIPVWLYLFKKYNLIKRNRLKILEIGSYEGMSALFLLETFPQANITCVDLWGNFSKSTLEKDKQNSYFTYQDKMSTEKKFDLNIKPYRKRIKKIRAKSLSFFSKQNESTNYDLIYIDGSHYVDDVLTDAVLAFNLLKEDGILIFDDYLWKFYSNPNHNPAAAINLFLKLKADSFKIIYVGYQIAIQRKSLVQF